MSAMLDPGLGTEQTASASWRVRKLFPFPKEEAEVAEAPRVWGTPVHVPEGLRSARGLRSGCSEAPRLQVPSCKAGQCCSGPGPPKGLACGKATPCAASPPLQGQKVLL